MMIHRRVKIDQQRDLPSHRLLFTCWSLYVNTFTVLRKLFFIDCWELPLGKICQIAICLFFHCMHTSLFLVFINVKPISTYPWGTANKKRNKGKITFAFLMLYNLFSKWKLKGRNTEPDRALLHWICDKHFTYHPSRVIPEGVTMEDWLLCMLFKAVIELLWIV